MYWVVYISPEILDSKEFRADVLAKPYFFEHLRVAFIDKRTVSAIAAAPSAQISARFEAIFPLMYL